MRKRKREKHTPKKKLKKNNSTKHWNYGDKRKFFRSNERIYPSSPIKNLGKSSSFFLILQRHEYE